MQRLGLNSYKTLLIAWAVSFLLLVFTVLADEVGTVLNISIREVMNIFPYYLRHSIEITTMLAYMFLTAAIYGHLGFDCFNFVKSKQWGDFLKTLAYLVTFTPFALVAIFMASIMLFGLN